MESFFIESLIWARWGMVAPACAIVVFLAPPLMRRWRFQLRVETREGEPSLLRLRVKDNWPFKGEPIVYRLAADRLEKVGDPQ